MNGAERETSDATCIAESRLDPQRFAVVFERHAGVIHRFLSRRVESAAVDDMLSETFVAAFRTRAGYDATYPDARPWLFGIAVNVVRHHRRSEGRRLVMVGRVTRDVAADHARSNVASHGTADGAAGGAAGGAADVAAAVVGVDELERVHRALARLDDRYREVLMLFAGPGFSYEEISRALQIPVGTVRSRLSRGRVQLRELLAASGQYPGSDRDSDSEEEEAIT